MKLATYYSGQASKMKDYLDEQKQQRADAAALPALERAEAMLNTPMSDAQRTELAAAIGSVKANAITGLPRLQAATQNIQKSREFATAEDRRERSRVERQKVQEAQIRRIDGLTTKARTGGSEGTAARLQLGALRTTLSGQRNAALRMLDLLSDPVKTPTATMDEAGLAAHRAKRTELQEKIEAIDSQIARIGQAQEQQVPSGVLAPQPPPAVKDRLSRQDPRYKAARQKGITDETLRQAPYNLELVP